MAEGELELVTHMLEAKVYVNHSANFQQSETRTTTDNWRITDGKSSRRSPSKANGVTSRATRARAPHRLHRTDMRVIQSKF